MVAILGLVLRLVGKRRRGRRSEAELGCRQGWRGRRLETGPLLVAGRLGSCHSIRQLGILGFDHLQSTNCRLLHHLVVHRLAELVRQHLHRSSQAYLQDHEDSLLERLESSQTIQPVLELQLRYRREGCRWASHQLLVAFVQVSTGRAQLELGFLCLLREKDREAESCLGLARV